MSERATHFGLILPNYGESLSLDVLRESATAAERSGFDSLWATDHVMVTSVHAPIYGTITEALVTLGYLTALTERVSLGVSALIVPMRNPFVVLKQLTSLDYLSGGRVVTAVAAGWMGDEFASLGANFDRRGRALDDWLDMASSVFAQMPGRVGHDGRPKIADGWMAPGLVRPGGPELWVAGVSDATIRRAARTGVWHPVALAPRQLRPMADQFKMQRPDGRIVLRINLIFAEEPGGGTDERGRHAISGPDDHIESELRTYLEAGCDGFVLNLSKDEPGLVDRVRRFGESLIPRFA
ncbi:MAG: LLM class flavin-dependent oxidoreductase [Actinomycetota bacterium]|nr:LLM class flavin-dependent oxidoreductase [Actinomycetota bacterium]